jgi:hypothetical protein
MELSVSGKSISRSASQVIPQDLWNPKIHFRVQKILSDVQETNGRTGSQIIIFLCIYLPFLSFELLSTVHISYFIKHITYSE